MTAAALSDRPFGSPAAMPSLPVSVTGVDESGALLVLPTRRQEEESVCRGMLQFCDHGSGAETGTIAGCHSVAGHRFSGGNLLLVIDVGNSNIVIGIYHDEDLSKDWRISTDKSKTTDEYGIMFHDLFRLGGHRLLRRQGHDHFLRGADPDRRPGKAGQQYFRLKPYVVGPGIKTGMPIHYDNPRGSRGRPDRQRHRRLRKISRHRADHRRLRHGNHLRLRQQERGILRRRHCPRPDDLHGGPVSEGEQAAAGGNLRPPIVIAKNTVNSMQPGSSWLRRAGRRHRHAHEGGG